MHKHERTLHPPPSTPTHPTKVSDITSDALFILLVEKDAAFMRLAEDRWGRGRASRSHAAILPGCWVYGGPGCM